MTKQEQFETTVIYSDEQFPYEDKKAVAAVDELVRGLKPDTIGLIGDQVDFASLSRFLKRLPPSKQDTLMYEVDYARRRFAHRAALAEEVGARVVYTKGNHEARLERYLEESAPAMFELFEDRLSFRSLLDIPEDWEVYEYNEGLWLGNKGGIWMTHGHYVAKSAPNTYMANYGHSGITGHTHRAGITFQTNRAGQNCWVEVGHLADPSRLPKASPVTNWQQACAVVYTSTTTKKFHVDLVPVIDGEIYYGGNKYVGKKIFR